MASLGSLALFLTLAVSIYATVVSWLGGRTGRLELVASARNAIFAIAGLTSLATFLLLYAFLTHDFRIEYVALYSSRDMSPTYVIASLWAGSEGSLLFWAWTMSIFASILAFHNRNLTNPLIPYVFAVVMTVQAFFSVLMAFVTNPFQTVPFPPPDGRGLNPLLENMGMFFHPPTLLLGYMGFTIPFAFAIAAMATRRLSSEWLTSIRRWTLIAWLFLGVGNILGMQWAYVELGWGGFWGWDPVENASFMPWLAATAFLHSVMIQKRRGMLKIWNIVLIIITFNLSIFGTFLTRSGVLSSVHSFGQSALGPFFIAFLAVGLLGSLGLLYSRRNYLKSEDELDSLISRESSFLFNNLILVGATFATFLGVIFPLISEATRGVKITVGPPFYNQVNGPIFMFLLLLMGICPLIGWRRASRANLLRNFLYPSIAGVVVAVAMIAVGLRQTWSVIAISTSAFVLSTILLEWFRGVRARRHTRQENYFHAFIRLVLSNRPRYGGYIVHLGIIILAFSIAGTMGYNTSKEVSIKPGESLSIGKYTLRYDSMSQYKTARKDVVVANLTVFNAGERIGTMSPEKFTPIYYNQDVTEVAIRSNLEEDLYVILMGWDRIGGVTAFKVIINPLMAWMWIGSIVLVGGGIFALWPERGRRPVRRGT
ncbi:MAG: heme lyase CcmF/NrfE family subunit [Chloroflexi bacterium]|nr:heme lyase CcmF/NrfE family subunit [Chloroflexota bacterium]